MDVVGCHLCWTRVKRQFFFGNRIALRDEPLDGSGVVLAEIIQLRDSAMAAMTFGEKNRLLTVDGSMQISTPPRGI